MPIVPKYCILCESEWFGGHERPGFQMKEGLRVFYKCGSSLSYKKTSDGIYKFLVKNCGKERKK